MTYFGHNPLHDFDIKYLCTIPCYYAIIIYNYFNNYNLLSNSCSPFETELKAIIAQW